MSSSLIKFKIVFDRRLFNDRYLPRNDDEDTLLFYEFVVRGEGRALLRIPFRHDTDSWKVEIYTGGGTPPRNRAPLSMAPHVLATGNSPLTFHVYKIVQGSNNKDHIGFVRQITEGSSDEQDVPVWVEGEPPPPFITALTRHEAVPALPPVTDIPLKETIFGGSQYWMTQRAFYRSSHTTSDDMVHRENIEVFVRQFVKKYTGRTFDTLCNMLVQIGRTLVKNRVRYTPDTVFAQSGAVPGDSGDALVELTTTGDCEDFGHMYMRVFRMIAATYKYLIPDKESDIYAKCKLLAEEYVPYTYICQVSIGGRLEFHSTMLILPQTPKHPVISFEVTNPDKSYTLPSKEFDDWHKQSYFLVDNYFLYRIQARIDSLTVQDVTKDCIRY